VLKARGARFCERSERASLRAASRIRKIAVGVVGLLLVASASLEFSATRVYANKVDCGKVMDEVAAGKKTHEIATDLSISTSSVYRCKKKAKAASAASPAAGTSPTAMASPAATAKSKKHKKSNPAGTTSPGAAASPAA
jgi:hypothetical protein